MSMTRRLSGLLLALSLSCAAGQAIAAQPILLISDQTRIIDLARQPGTVVVGNPSIAEASIQGQKIFLHGRGFGTTNIIILDEQGSQIADFEVDVKFGGNNNISVYKAGLQHTYICNGECEAIMHPGDNPDFFKELAVKPTQEKMNLATGQKTAEADQPAPAQ